jgi:hypothetical protein
MHERAYDLRMDVEWDSAKALSNLRKHGVDFADAVSALEDEGALTRPDPDARDEERFVSLGMDAEGRVLVTVFSMRAETVRLISARKASPGERRRYGAD